MVDPHPPNPVPSRLGERARTVAGVLAAAVEQVCAVLLGAMTAVILLGVAFRYVLEAPLPWSEELAKLLMLWIVFLGVTVASVLLAIVVVCSRAMRSIARGVPMQIGTDESTAGAR